MIFLDLFSGIGGFALGAYNAGLRFDRHYFSEIDPWCCKLYQRRFPYSVPLGDITKIDGISLIANSKCMGWEKGSGEGIQSQKQKAERQNSRDVCAEGFIIAGGFPCQDISVAGKGAGITGARSGLWFEYARLIGEIRPRYAIMENVGALTRRGLDAVLGSLAEIGYDAEWSDIRASDVGAPHRRERIWIVAYPQEQRSGEARGLRREQSEEWSTRIREEVADTESDVLEGQRPDAGEPALTQPRNCGWWSVEPDVGRVAHGVPKRVDRLRGLGNAIVPQIAEMIFRQIRVNTEAEA